MKKILFLSSLLLSGSVFAQKGGMITVGEVPRKVQKPDRKERSKSAQAGYGENSLTLGITSFLGGNTPVMYERVIAGPLTLQVGAGVTSRSFTSLYGEGLLDDNHKEGRYFDRQPSGTNITDDYSNYDFRKALPGWSFSLSPRVYFNDEALDGKFLGILADYRSYRWATQMLDPGPRAGNTVSSIDYFDDFTSQTQTETQKGVDLSIVYGLHQEYAKHVAVSYVLGFGIRFSESVRQDLGYVRNTNGDYQYVNQTVDFSNRRLLFTAQMNIGGWW